MKPYNEQEFNCFCAEFLEWEYIPENANDYSFQNYGWWIKGTYSEDADPLNNPNWKGFNSNLKFHSDYNWIMKVVEKIQSVGYDFEIKLVWHHFSNSKHTQIVLSKTEGEFAKDRSAMFNLTKVYNFISPTSKNLMDSLIITLWQFFNYK